MTTLITTSQLGMGLAAGLAAAILFMVVKTGSALAFLLYFVSPLPVIIATLGWSHRAGLVAVFAGTVLVALGFGAQAGLVFGFGVALPSWFAGYLVLLARPTDDADTGATTLFWYPLGHILLILCAVSAAMTLAGAMIIGGSYAGFVAAFTEAVDLVIKADPELLSLIGKDRDSLGPLFVLLAPPISSSVGVLSSVMLLWLAAKLVAASGRLPRPWPDLAMTAMPRVAISALVVAIGLSAVLSGFAALFFRSFAAALGMAYALQGAAALNVLTRGKRARSLILSGLVLLLVVMPGWPVIALALFGLADAVLSFRLRAEARASLSPSLPDR